MLKPGLENFEKFIILLKISSHISSEMIAYSRQPVD